MKRHLVLAALSLLVLAGAGGAETIDRIAAVVNDEIVTTHQLDLAVSERLTTEAAGKKPSATEMETLRRRVLMELVDESLVRQRTTELGLKVGEDEIEAAVQDVQKQNKLTREQLIEALKAEGMDFDEYRESLRQQILRFKLLGREVQSKVEVTSQEVRDYFREHIDDYRQAPTLSLSRLTFPLPARATAVQTEAVRARAEEALGRLRQGEDFYGVLLAYSADRSAEGGELGTFAEGELTLAFERAVRDLREGEITGIIATAEAFHILKVTGRTAGSIRQFDAVKGEIERRLKEKKNEEAFRKWAEGLRKNAYIDIRL